MEEVLVGDIWTIKAVWICVPCSKVSTKNTQFDNRDDFLDHLKRHCHICNQAFTSYKCSQIHFSNEHLKKNRIGQNKDTHLCSLCGKIFLTKVAFESHVRKHKTLGCLGCPRQFNDFKDYCSHANLCKPSWKLMVTSFISYECFACKKSCKTLQQLMEHYNSCIIAIDLDVKRCNIGVVEVKDEIMFSNINFIRKKSTQISATLFIKVASKDVVPKDFNEPPLGSEENTVQKSIPSPPKKSNAKPTFKKIEPNSSSTISIYQISNGTIKPYKEVILLNEKPQKQQNSKFSDYSEPEIIQLVDDSPPKKKVTCNKVSSSNIPAPVSNKSRNIVGVSTSYSMSKKMEEKDLFKNHICYICQESVADWISFQDHFIKHREAGMAGRNIELGKIMVQRVVCYLCGVRRREYKILVRHFNLVHKNQPIDPLKVGMDVATPFNLGAEKEAEMMSLPIPKPVFQVISHQENVPKTNNNVSISQEEDIVILDDGHGNDSGLVSKNEEQRSNTEFSINNDATSQNFINDENSTIANHNIIMDDNLTEKNKVVTYDGGNDEEENRNFGLKISSVISLSAKQLESKQNEVFIDDLLLQEGETSSDIISTTKERKFNSEKNISNERRNHDFSKKSKLDKGCYVKITPLKTKASSLKVIKVNLPPPQDFLPLGLKNFDLLDAQPGIDFPEECPTKHNIIRRSDDSIQKEKVYGFYNGCWAIETSEEVIEAVENVSMIVEDSDGKVNQSWCQMAT